MAKKVMTKAAVVTIAVGLSAATFISPATAYGNDTLDNQGIMQYGTESGESPKGVFPESNKFESKTDKAHISYDKGVRTVSVHGWWNHVEGPAVTATVRVEL